MKKYLIIAGVILTLPIWIVLGLIIATAFVICYYADKAFNAWSDKYIY